jgi:hypothetical protein
MSQSALIVTHHVFLTREQRYALQNPNESIVVTGVSSPVWVKDGKWETDVAHEVFSKYQIRTTDKEDKHTVRILYDNYLVTLTGSMQRSLKDFTDGGTETLMLTHRNALDHNGEKLPILHCLEIEDISRLEKTIS